MISRMKRLGLRRHPRHDAGVPGQRLRHVIELVRATPDVTTAAVDGEDTIGVRSRPGRSRAAHIRIRPRRRQRRAGATEGGDALVNASA